LAQNQNNVSEWSDM